MSLAEYLGNPQSGSRRKTEVLGVAVLGRTVVVVTVLRLELNGSFVLGFPVERLRVLGLRPVGLTLVGLRDKLVGSTMLGLKVVGCWDLE